MRSFFRFTLLLTLMITLSSAVLPILFFMNFPRPPGPELDRQTRSDGILYIKNKHPDIVLLGDSTLMFGVDDALLAQSTGKSVYNMGKPGSASAMWYLLLKNVIVESSPKPRYVIIVFRNTILTAPGYRVQGNYLARLDEYARKNESLFIENSFVKLMNPLEVFSEKYFPLYVLRTRIREKIEMEMRHLGPVLLGCDAACTDAALLQSFAAADFEPDALEDALNSAENLLYTDEQLDFQRQVNDSYLPELIRLAHENEMEIIFVRIKVESYEQPALDDYIQDLFRYLDENDARYLDFGDDARLVHDLFEDSVHLNQEGKVLFTRLLVVGLEEIFAKAYP
jgi:hypothetical protein